MYSDELMHYGVQGMKWGVRRYQPYPDGSVNGKFVGRRKMARQAKRALNYNDKKMARAAYDLNISKERANRFIKKAQKVKSPIKRAKLLNKASAEKGDIKELQRRINEGKAVSQQIIRDMGKQGFATQKDITIRDVHKGQNVASMVLGALGAVGMSMANPSGFGVGVYRKNQIEGVKYKVKDTQKLSQNQIQKIGQHNARTNRLLEDMRDSRYYGTGKTSRRDQKLLGAKEKKSWGVYPEDIDKMRKLGMDDSAIIQTAYAMRDADKKVSKSLKDRGVTQYNHDKFSEADIHRILDAIDKDKKKR